MGRLTQKEIDAAKIAYLKAGGKILKVPPGGTRDDPMSVPAGPLREAAIRASKARRSQGNDPFRYGRNAAGLKKMVEGGRSLAEIVDAFYGRRGIHNAEQQFRSRANNVFQAMRDFGIEPTERLISDRESLWAGERRAEAAKAVPPPPAAGVTPAPLPKHPGGVMVEAMDLVREGGSITGVAEIFDISADILAGHVERFFDHPRKLQGIKTFAAMERQILTRTGEMEVQPVHLCLVCRGARGSMEGRSGSRCAVCAGEASLKVAS